MIPRIAITTGEPAGIGPEIALEGARVARVEGRIRPVLIGDGSMLATRARAAGIVVTLVPCAADAERPSGAVEVVDIPLAAPCVPGRLDASNGRYVLSLIEHAIDGALDGRFDAVVTAPVQKSVINEAGVPFTGHTELFAERTGAERVVMMLAGALHRGEPDALLRVALVTTHLALKDVPAAITIERVLGVLRILHADLRDKFGVASPRILVAGLNPHAGEGGYLGREEIESIAPALEAARAEGIAAHGPYPADTLFQPRYLDDCDAVLAMYHDQGLPVLKFATFGHGVNVTLGLPIVRTSVDHGTALDLAGSPDPMAAIDAGSMKAAIEVAATMARARRMPRTAVSAA